MIDTLTLILLEAAEAVCNLLKKEEVTNGRGELLSYTFSLLFTVGTAPLLKYNAFPISSSNLLLPTRTST